MVRVQPEGLGRLLPISNHDDNKKQGIFGKDCLRGQVEVVYGQTMSPEVWSSSLCKD